MPPTVEAGIDESDLPKTGLLSIVPTPIGNADDITLRALRVLREADLIAAEDPRVTARLLKRYGIETPLIRCASTPDEISTVLARLREGATVALVCDAGTPTIADPGAVLVRAALAQGTQVIALPGPTALIVALAASGLAAHRFAFDGFPPRGRADRSAYFLGLTSETRAIVLYESAAYLTSTLLMLRDRLGAERPITIAHDLTAAHEKVWRGTLGTACEWTRAVRPRGQCTLVVAGRQPDSGTK